MMATVRIDVDAARAAVAVLRVQCEAAAEQWTQVGDLSRRALCSTGPLDGLWEPLDVIGDLATDLETRIELAITYNTSGASGLPTGGSLTYVVPGDDTIASVEAALGAQIAGGVLALEAANDRLQPGQELTRADVERLGYFARMLERYADDETVTNALFAQLGPEGTVAVPLLLQQFGADYAAYAGDRPDQDARWDDHTDMSAHIAGLQRQFMTAFGVALAATSRSAEFRAGNDARGPFAGFTAALVAEITGGWGQGWGSGPADDAGAATTRRVLAQLPDAQFADLVERFPAVAVTLMRPADLSADPRFATLAAAAAIDSGLDRVTAVAKAFADLAATDQAMLARLYPWLVGNLDGAPVWARDRANRTVLQGTIAELPAAIAAAEQRLDEIARGITSRRGAAEWQAASAYLDGLRGRLAMLEVVQTELAASREYRLMLLDTEMPGRAAIAIGDVDTADHVVVIVPGFSAAVTNYLPLVIDDAFRVEHRGADVLRARGGAETVAAVAWIGYHAPMAADVLFDGDARRGGEQLTATLGGIEASRNAVGGEVHLTVVGHSYGSLVAGYAARADAPIDDLVVIGSPGVGVQTVEDLGLLADHVFVGVAGGDFIGESGYFSRTPDSDYFGATVFQTDGGDHPLADEQTLPATGHSQYYREGTESLWNIVSVATGRYGAITVEGRPDVGGQG